MTEYLNNGCGLIAKERDRQIKELGYDVRHDELYSDNQLAMAGVCYALREIDRPVGNMDITETLWPWDKKYWKPSPDDRIRELIKAGALIAAQIDRELYELENKNKYGHE